MDKLLFKRILVAALTVLAIVYVAYLLISANFDMYPTENAVLTTVTDKIYSNGFIIRDETIIPNNTNGVLSFSCSDGDAVNVKGEIANISGTMSLDIINNNIKGKLITYLDDANKYNINAVKADSDNLLASINQRLLYTGNLKNFNQEINELSAQIEQLRSSAGKSTGSIESPKAGYFSEYCDGYESSIKYSDVKNLTLDQLNNVSQSEVPANTAGKVIGNVKWYIACEVDQDEAQDLTIWDSNVTVLLTEACTEAIPAEIFKITQTGDGKALVVLQCDYMNEGILQARKEPIEIGLGTYTGLRVSKKAIHDDYVTKTTYDDNDNSHKEQKKVQGVYVLYGSEVQFKQVSIIYADEDYVICDTEPQEGVLFNGETISLYDKVILKGDDLYDGKVIS